MTKAEYADYEKRVADFFEREGIQNLSTGHITCPTCEVEFDDEGQCPECKADRQSFDEPHFSWRCCECCQRRYGGDRYHCSGWNPTAKAIQEYDVCVDCMYYSEYGRLDDTTMMEVEADGKLHQ